MTQIYVRSIASIVDANSFLLLNRVWILLSLTAKCVLRVMFATKRKEIKTIMESYILATKRADNLPAVHLQEIVPNGLKSKHDFPIHGTEVDMTKMATLEN